ncbi:MAG: carboxymuconolactone decarboxylase family protein, partial [Ilumatobacter sp.]
SDYTTASSALRQHDAAGSTGGSSTTDVRIAPSMADRSNARVGLLSADQAPLLMRDVYAGGDPGPIAAALATVPELAAVTLPFIGGVLGPSALDVRTKELVILRTSVVASCRYCVDAHTVVALDVGLTADEVHRLRGRGGDGSTPFDARDVALLAWVDEVAGGRGEVPDAIFDAFAVHFVDHEIVELTLLASTTLLLNRFCTALRLPTSTDTADRLRQEGVS